MNFCFNMIALVMAGGKGTRMNSSEEKLLLEYSDRPSGPQLITMWNNGKGLEKVKNGLKTMFPEHF